MTSSPTIDFCGILTAVDRDPDTIGVVDHDGARPGTCAPR